MLLNPAFLQKEKFSNRRFPGFTVPFSPAFILYFCRENILKYYLMYVYRYYFLIYKAVLSCRMIIFEGNESLMKSAKITFFIQKRGCKKIKIIKIFLAI